MPIVKIKRAVPKSTALILSVCSIYLCVRDVFVPLI